MSLPGTCPPDRKPTHEADLIACFLQSQESVDQARFAICHRPTSASFYFEIQKTQESWSPLLKAVTPPIWPMQTGEARF